MGIFGGENGIEIVRGIGEAFAVARSSEIAAGRERIGTIIAGMDVAQTVSTQADNTEITHQAKVETRPVAAVVETPVPAETPVSEAPDSRANVVDLDDRRRRMAEARDAAATHAPDQIRIPA